MRPSLVRTLSLLALLVASCAEEPAPPLATGGERLAPPEITDFGGGAWTSTEEDATVIARVDGAPITRAAVAAAIEADPGLSPREALDRLVEMEVLAQEAMRRDLHRHEAVRRTWREALAQTWLHVFQEELSPSDIPMEQVRRIYSIPRIRKLYDHFDAWRMAHLFITCCDPKVEGCDTPGVMRCFEDAGRVIHEVYGEVKARAEAAGASGDPEGIVEVMKAYRADVGERLPQLAYRERAFYYQPDKPHEEQSGYNLIAEPVARTVIDAPMAVLQEPVQSSFGWHILVKLDHDPEERLGPDDPEVFADIRENAFEGFVAARFRDVLQEMLQRDAVRLFPERLESLAGGVAASAAPPDRGAP